MRTLVLALGCLAMLPPLASAEMPLYVRVPLPQRPAHGGCRIAASRDSLVAQLRELGFQGGPPAIHWNQGKAAVLLASPNGSMAPAAYEFRPTEGALLLRTKSTSPEAGGALYVMEITKAASAATGCVLVSTVNGRQFLLPGPHALTSAARMVDKVGTPDVVIVPGPVAGTQASPH